MRAHTWETWKLSHAYGRMGSGTTPTSSDARYYTSSDGVPWVTTAELRENYISATQQQVTLEALEDFPALRMYRPGSVMMAMYGATIGRLGIIEVAATCNQACCVFEASDRFDNRFLFYWLWHRRGDLIALSVGGGQPNLSQQDLREERALCPPFETQRRIARFLDEKTARIDGLIEKKRMLLDRLAEKRQALITHAVTKGLNPDASMKPSGIDWLGDIPAHWEVRRIKELGKLIGGSGFPHDFQGQRDLELPFFKVVDLSHVSQIHKMLDAENSVDRTTAKLLGAAVIRPGDVAFAKVGAALLLNRFRSIGIPCCIDNNMMAFRSGPRISTDFALLAFSRINFSDIVNPGAVPSVSGGQVGQIEIALPYLDEQHDIAEFLKQSLKEIEFCEEQVARSPMLIEEYRAALITAAVTGQLAELR